MIDRSPVVAPDGVTVEATGEVTHRCPFADEVDHGTVTVRWTCDGMTLELHYLRGFLDEFRDVKISHEQLVERVRVHAAAQAGVTDVSVTGEFFTAGMRVRVGAGAVLGDRLRAQGA